MDPEDADYKCTLTEYSLQKAIKELNEDPKQRLGAVQSLRKWIRDQPHYTCRTGERAHILNLLLTHIKNIFIVSPCHLVLSVPGTLATIMASLLQCFLSIVTSLSSAGFIPVTSFISS